MLFGVQVLRGRRVLDGSRIRIRPQHTVGGAGAGDREPVVLVLVVMVAVVTPNRPVDTGFGLVVAYGSGSGSTRSRIRRPRCTRGTSGPCRAAETPAAQLRSSSGSTHVASDFHGMKIKGMLRGSTWWARCSLRQQRVDRQSADPLRPPVQDEHVDHPLEERKEREHHQRYDRVGDLPVADDDPRERPRQRGRRQSSRGRGA